MTVTFEQLIAGLEARPSGDQFTARCPAHDDRHPSLGIALRGGRLLLYCRTGCDFWRVVEGLEERGLWPVEIQDWSQQGGNRLGAKVERDVAQIMVRIDEQLKPIANTRVDRYLTGRRITIRPNNVTELSHHPALYHPWSGTTWPAMVALVRNVAGEVVDFHRTWLSYAEPVVKAKLHGQELKPPRAWLRSIVGHAVHLSPAAETLLVGEGIETVLSAMQMYGLPGWAAGAAGNLPKLILPPSVRRVVLLVDDDESGAGERMTAQAALRFRHQGRQVERIRPDGLKDFNDLLVRGNYVRS